jgi:hypothetical protein
LESDIFPGSNIIEGLVWDKQNIVTSLYLIGKPDKSVRVPCITLSKTIEDGKTKGTRLITREELPEYYMKGLKQVAAGGMGVCLIYRPVLEKVAFTYIPDLSQHSDVFFFATAARYGFPCFVDTNLICAHKYSDWEKVKDR